MRLPFGNPAAFFTAVLASLKGKPQLMNSVCGGALCGASDILAQGLAHDEDKVTDWRDLDLRRCMAATLIGSILGGVVYPTAYAKLDSMWTGKDFASIFTKAFVEIITVGVLVNAVSMSSRGLLAGRKCNDVAKHLTKELPSITKNDFKVWLPYNMLAFSVIPPFIRPSVTMLMEAMWQTYISLRSNDYSSKTSKRIST